MYGISRSLFRTNQTPTYLFSGHCCFWDDKKFISNKHLIRLKENSVENWTTEIVKLHNNSEKLENLSLDGHKLINEDYNLKVFHNKLIKILELD